VATTDDRDGVAVETTRVVPADGDDIVVVPALPGDPHHPGLVRRALVAAAIVAVLALGTAFAIASRHTGSTVRVRTTSPPTLSPLPVVVKTHLKSTVPRAKRSPTVAVTTVPRIHSVPPVVVPPARSVPAAPTTAAPPKQYGPSVLTWDAPRSLSIAAGKSATLPVTAHNPTDGTVTLPYPLSCTPRLDNGEMCPAMVQLIGAGQSASTRFTIEARGVAKGKYTLKIEGVLTVAVTVS
jgi:hypothetical protein